MLSDGIYEQIVNTKIGKELELLDQEKYDINLENLTADDARRVLTIYISYVISQGLKVIRENYPNSKEKDTEALLAQIRLCNDIVKEIAEHASDTVDFLVSFIKWSAIRPLLPELMEFTKRDGAIPAELLPKANKSIAM